MPAVPVPPDLWEIAAALVPGASPASARLATGQFHHVVQLPGVAAVRISRDSASACALARRTEVVRQVAACGLPFAVPEPLTPVTQFGDRAAVAVSWVDGAGGVKGDGDPAELRALLTAIRDVQLTDTLTAVLGAEPPDSLARRTQTAAAWLERTAGWELP